MEADGTVVVDSERLKFVGAGLPAGTRVRITLGRWFTCVSEADWQQAEAHASAAEARRQAQWRAARNQRRVEAEAFHARLRLPVRWTAGIKDVLSGLTQDSNCDGRNRATVQHIHLLEDLQAGRLRRHAGDFLCTSVRGSNGKRYSGQTETSHYDGDGQPYSPIITCSACLKLAARWTIPASKP